MVHSYEFKQNGGVNVSQWTPTQHKYETHKKEAALISALYQSIFIVQYREIGFARFKQDAQKHLNTVEQPTTGHSGQSGYYRRSFSIQVKV